MIQGMPAPAFALPNQHGQLVSLDDHPEAWLVLWWFPRADTPG
jgi:thioredoxin-dependent peroxiredoxin